MCTLALGAIFGTGRAAHAETVTATLQTVDPYVFGTVHLDGAGDIGGGIGTIVWQGDASNDSPFNGQFTTYCIDLLEDINFGNTYTYTVGNLQTSPKPSAFPGGNILGGMGVLKFNEIAELFAQHYAATLPGGNADQREAFQLAIWNMVYDTDTSVSTGDGAFYATGNIDGNAITIANGWLVDAASLSNQLTYHATDLISLVGGPGVQDQVAIDPNITISTGTPLPNSALGGSLLLAGLSLAGVRKRRQSLANHI
jgi:hypothetical protein